MNSREFDILSQKIDKLWTRLEDKDDKDAKIEELNQEIATIMSEKDAIVQEKETLKGELTDAKVKNSDLRKDLDKYVEEENRKKNSYEKGKIFADDKVEYLKKRYPKYTVTNTSGSNHTGDCHMKIPLIYDGDKITETILFEWKAGQEAIDGKHIHQTIRDAALHNAMGAILVKESFPKSYEKYDGLFDISADEEKMLTCEPPFDFNSKMFIICTPERIDDAVCALLYRYRGPKIMSDENHEFVSDVVSWVDPILRTYVVPLLHMNRQEYVAQDEKNFKNIIKMKRYCENKRGTSEKLSELLSSFHETLEIFQEGDHKKDNRTLHFGKKGQDHVQHIVSTSFPSTKNNKRASEEDKDKVLGIKRQKVDE